MTIETILFLLGMSLLAGILNGIVGMAALTLYPVLLSVGVAPITANATNTIGLLFSGSSPVAASRHELKDHWHQALVITLLNTIGGVFGALILIHSSNAGFKRVVPFIIFLAGVLILMPPKPASSNSSTRQHLRWLGYVLVMLVGIYVGYFGAGAGLLMVAVLSRLVEGPYATYNAMRNLASLVNNLVTSIMFIFSMPIAWGVLIPVCIGLFAGGFLGPVIVRLIPSRIIKTAVGIFALGLAVFLFYQAYL